MALLPAAGHAQGYPGYPYSIITPERGAGIHQRGSTHRGASGAETTPAAATIQPDHPSLLDREKFIAKLHRRGLYAARGSSGSVLAPHPAHSTGGRRHADGPAVAAGAGSDPHSRHGENHSQSAPRSGDVSGPSLTLHVPVRPLRRAGKSAQSVYGRVPAVMLGPHPANRHARPCAGYPDRFGNICDIGIEMAGTSPAMTNKNVSYYRKLALILASAAEPGQSSFSPSALSGASTVFK